MSNLKESQELYVFILIIHLQYEFIFTHYCNKKGHHSVMLPYNIYIIFDSIITPFPIIYLLHKQNTFICGMNGF